MTWATKRTFLTMLIVLVTSITCACAMVVAGQGISHRGELLRLHTRAEVCDKFGKPDDMRTCPDGRVVESRWIRQQLKPSAAPSPNPSGMADAALQGAVQGAAITVGLYLAVLDIALLDIPGTAVTAYQSEKKKLHYAFVYDEAGQILYMYDLTRPAPLQFYEATRHLCQSLCWQLEAGNCDTWTACLTDYVQEARRRASCLGYTLSADEEQAFERMFDIGEKVDSGTIPREEGLPEIQKVVYAEPAQ